MGWKISNFAESTLAQAIAAADTTLYVDADEVDDLPSLGVGDKAKAVLFSVVGGVVAREIVNITAWTGDGTVTVERAQEATVAQDWAAGTRFVHTPTAEVLQTLLDAIALTLFSGTAVGTNTIVVTLPSSIPIPTEGDLVTFRAVADNTGPVTIQITNGSLSIGPYDVVHQDGSALDAGDIQDDWHIEVRYYQATGDFVLVNQASHQYEIDQINDGPIAAFNLFENGSFDAWNQGTSFNTPASATEVSDSHAVIYDGTIGAFTFTRQVLALDAGVQGNPKYFARWDQSSAGSASTVRKLRIPMRRVNRLAGRTVTASIWLKADSARTVTGRLVQYFGTGGGPSADVVAGSEAWSVTTAWQKFDVTVDLASINLKTIGSDGNDALVLDLLLPLNTSMTIEFAGAQLEYGERASYTQVHGTPWGWGQGGVGGSWRDEDEFLQTLWSELYALSNISVTGLLVRSAANTYLGRTIATASAAGLTVTNGSGVAGNPSIDLSTGLVQYAQDPMSVAELASVTGTFGTAAFLPDSNIVHIAGAETITGIKRFEQAVATNLLTLGNTTNTSYLAPRWTSATVFELVPAPSGTPDATKGFGYDVTNTRWFVDTNLLVSGVSLWSDGSVAAPSAAFASAPTYGFYLESASQIGWTVAGTRIGRFFSSGVFLDVGKYFAPGGSAAAPVFTYTGDTDTGEYNVGADNIGWSCGGTLRMDLSTSRLLMASGIDIVFNSATGPSSQFSAGFRGVPNIAGTKSGNYTTVLTDAGGCVQCSATLTLTIPANSSVAYPTDTVIMIENLNGSGNVTVHPDTGVTLRRGDAIAGTGDRIVAADSAAYIKKKGTNEWYIYGLFT